MSRDLNFNEAMSTVDEAERKDSRRFFQQPIGLPVARIAPVTSGTAIQQNSRPLFKTYVRSQANVQIPSGCTSAAQKMMHAHGTATVSSTSQCASALSGRSKLVAIRPAIATHSFLKSYDVSHLSASPLATVYLQQQQNLHIANTQQPVVSLSSSRARECEEPRIIRSSPATFTNCGNLDSRRYLAPGRSVVSVGDVSLRSPMRVNAVCTAPTAIPSRNGCKVTAKDLVRGSKTVARISDDKTDGKPVMMPLPALKIACSSTATSVSTLPSSCISVATGQHDTVPGSSYCGPSARPTILRKNRELGSGSAVRRLIFTESHPQSGYREVMASPVTAMKDTTGLLCLKRAISGENRLANAATFPSSDPRTPAVLSKKASAVLVDNVVSNTRSCADQVPVVSSAEISPRKRLRKQNFDCSNPEKMKLLISTDRITGDAFVAVKDESTWRTADLDDAVRPVEDNMVIEKVSKRRSRTCTDNGLLGMPVQQLSLPLYQEVEVDVHTKAKRMKKVQTVVSRNKLIASEVSETAEIGLMPPVLSGCFVDEKQAHSLYMQASSTDVEMAKAQSNEKWDRQIESAVALLCHVFGLATTVPDDPYPESKEVVVGKSLCDLPSTFCFFGDETSENDISNKTTARATYNRQIMITKEATGKATSTASVNLPDDKTGDGKSELECEIAAEQAWNDTVRCIGLKNRVQRLDRMSGCECVLKRIYMKSLMLQNHFRGFTKQTVPTSVDLCSNLVATLEDYSATVAKRQTENFLGNYPICTPSTSYVILEKSMADEIAHFCKYLEQTLEICTRNVTYNTAGTSHASPQRSSQTVGRSCRGLHSDIYASRRDPETQMLQSVAEALAEIIEIVVENDEYGRWEEESKQQMGRKRKKKEEQWLEVKISERFGTFALPHSLPETLSDVVALYDHINQYTLKRKRKSNVQDLDDAFFMNIKNVLHIKKKRMGDDKSFSRFLRSLSQVRTVHLRLSDIRKIECDNLSEAAKLILDHVKCTDPRSYSELMNEHNEDCQPYDSEKTKEEKWEKRLLSFTKAVPQCIIPASSSYNPTKAVNLHPLMNHIVRLFKGKCCHPPRRLRLGVKRLRKSQSRRGRGRQRGIPRSRKKPLTPEPQLEDLEPHFTVAGMGEVFQKEFEIDMETFRYKKRQQMDLKLTSDIGDHMKRESELATAVSVQSQSCTENSSILQRDVAMKTGEDYVVENKIREPVSEEPDVGTDGDNMKSSEARQEQSSSGSRAVSSEAVPSVDYAVNGRGSLLEHIRTRGRYVREHFATLLHALRINELLSVKSVRMFKDYTTDLFSQECKATDST